MGAAPPEKKSILFMDIRPDLPSVLIALPKKEVNKPGYGQLYIFDPIETTTKRLDN
jgi:hypothetical protein